MFSTLDELCRAAPRPDDRDSTGTRLLVITADDLGLDPRRDEGIFAAHSAGALTQASLMVGGATAVQAARRARQARLALGLHLDLSETPPLACRERIPSLLDSDGRKLGKNGLRFALAQGSVDPAEVILEAEAQFDAFARLTGEDARHVDGHQHIHWSVWMAETLVPLFRRRGVRSTRAVVPSRETRTRAIYAEYGVRSTHGFIALDMDGHGDCAAGLTDAVLTYPPGTSVELMCHVGFAGVGGDDFNRSPDREHELRFLCSHPLQPSVDTGCVELVSFDELFRRGFLC